VRAAVCREYGPPEKLAIETLPDPAPGPGQALVEVRSAAVNYPDVLILANRYQMSAKPPFTPGSEIAGVVRAVGEGVANVKAGDAVAGSLFVGAFAELVCLDAANLTPIRAQAPADFDRAAAFWVCHSTAYLALLGQGRLARGETLCVLGAAGGVGLAAVELGKLLGARVIAVASSAEKLAVAREAGADEFVDYAREDLKQRLKDLTGGRGVDVVIDPVGGAATEAALRALAFRGRLVIVGFASGEIPKLPANLVLLRNGSVVGFEIGGYLSRAREEAGRLRAELLAHFREGRIQPRICATYPLARTADALRQVGERRALGKVVIRVAE
jgi:NADPH2:quinone reductase